MTNIILKNRNGIYIPIHIYVGMIQNVRLGGTTLKTNDEVEVEQLNFKPRQKITEPVSLNGLKLDAEQRVIQKRGTSECVTLPASFLDKLKWFRGAVLKISLVEPDDPRGGLLVIELVKEET